MTRTEIISRLKKINLNQDFEFYFRQNIFFGFEFKDSNRNFSLLCDFGINAEPESTTIKNLGLNICYIHLHKLLDPTFGSAVNDDEPSDMRTKKHNKIFNNEISFDTSYNFPCEIASETDLNDFVVIIEQFWKNDAVPFFEYWSDLRSLLPFIETEVPSELAEILRHRLIEKKMIIWKLCSHPKYDFFIQERKEILEKAMIRNPQKKNLSEMYSAIEVMEDRLINVEPLYVWDDSLLIPKPYKGIMPKTISNSI